ncbi:cytochrome P450 2C20-like [Crotalus tigris]|uniref:cytochrome P450 2C20-like n=1 Tax=Crotalus tigris TaxID=88082 RepID=UPI00192FB5E0|nr:cytochrome P450 2C20-like [Crotalus tigris]XP_039220614.1 cytochrome P450 2C20-like [Crotalus tigris]XP_039220615.1 cytochrome P450 2C20-like [Crotalus tigris]XP_039220616.1 cytochrome P450 2C20-like [Crotalus tigris]XP_039220618.1 cytochrome P450 2C20-like [Crotalus tigris]XP_039220619.1 cytochrome P450 2C20-like [Crotalus tigris]
MELTWTGVLLLLCVLFTLFSSFQMYKKKRQLPAGPTPWPILGNLLQQDVLPLYKNYEKLIGQYGPIFTIWIGSKPMVALCGYDMIKNALIDHAEEFGGRIIVPTIERIFRNHGLATANERKWKEMRHFILSTLRNFGMGKKQMSERVQEEAFCLVEEVESMQGQPFEPKRKLRSAVSNVICAVVFGNRFDYKDQTFMENQNAVESLLKLCSNFTGMVYNSFPKIMEYFPGQHTKTFAEIEKLCDFIHEKVVLHQKTLDIQEPRDFIDCFLIKLEKEQNSSEIIYTPENLVRSVLELFFAGTVSTSNALVSSLLVMAKLPQLQAKVQKEIDEMVGTNRIPSMEDRLKMPFTNAVLHEVQRCWKDSLETFPRATTCDIKFHGYNIPKYMAIVPVLPSVNYDPLQWETPEKFNPDHFLDEKRQFRKRDAFMAFSAGKRSCPGEALARMELFLFFSTLLQNFTFHLDVDTKGMDVISFIKDLKDNQFPFVRAIKR